MNIFKIKRFFRNIFKIIFQFVLLHYLSRPGSNQSGYNIFGYYSKIGQGEVARAFADELISAGERFVLIDFFDINHKRIPLQEEMKYRLYYYKKFIFRINVFFIDPVLLNFVRKNASIIFKNKHNVVVFWWEFETGFEDRISVLNKFDEVYVFSDFIKKILCSIENRSFQVTKMKLPFHKNWIIEDEPEYIKCKYHLEGKFCFFFNFDYLSSYNRKNPEAILKAISEEFQSDMDVVFVVKTNNNEKFTEKEERFKNIVKSLGLFSRVTIIKNPLSRNEFMTLINAMDCYISLHRGEGLGLGIIEALALHKPVIATNYGGNTEYMNNPLAYAVNYTLVQANDDYCHYKNVKYWAEPDLNCAKKHLREVYTRYNLNKYI